MYQPQYKITTEGKRKCKSYAAKPTLPQEKEQASN